MSAATEQIGTIFHSIPFQKKVVISFLLLLVAGGFLAMFMVGNKMEYQPLFGKLSSDDAAIIVDKLREQRVPFKIEGGGSLILVPADKVYDIRLSLAGLGLPKGGTVGFEIFDKTDFGTTEFVQKLNYQRALQGELARTIREFNEVADARVMIVMSRDSVFIEETKPPSASVMLTLRSELSKSKVAAVVNLVASAVEGLTPDLVTVVDTSGKVLNKKSLAENKVGELADSQLEYKTMYESNLARRIQSMLEQIAGPGKAIVRVSADMDFSIVDTNEEVYDPDAQVMRSRQISTESQDSTKGASTASVSSVNPGTAGASAGSPAAEKSQRQNETVNYEINRTVRRTTKPMAEVKRLSVAAVLDGNYTMETGKEGNPSRQYVARTQAELDQFRKIVQQAMGYNADREDQVTVESLPFSDMTEIIHETPSGVDWMAPLRRYGHMVGYAVLILISFLFIVRPVIQAISEVSVAVEQQGLPDHGGARRTLPAPDSLYALPEPTVPNAREKAVALAKQDPDKAVEHVRSWLSEAS